MLTGSRGCQPDLSHSSQAQSPGPNAHGSILCVGCHWPFVLHHHQRQASLVLHQQRSHPLPHPLLLILILLLTLILVPILLLLILLLIHKGMRIMSNMICHRAPRTSPWRALQGPKLQQPMCVQSRVTLPCSVWHHWSPASAQAASSLQLQHHAGSVR